MTATWKRLRRSLEQMDDMETGEADRSYNDGNVTDPEWLAETDYYGDEQDCSMDCQNGGSCELGRAIHGFAAELMEDEHVHYNDRYTIMHCVCPTGWTGLNCEIKLKECPSSEICFNGNKCQLAEDDFGMPFRHCECDATSTDFTLPYVTHFCGQTATVSCAADRITASHSFCKNGGKCIDMISKSNQAHNACECTEGWEGPHCAHLVGTYPEVQPVEPKDKVAFALFGAAVALYILGTVWFYNRKRRRARNGANNGTSPCPSRSSSSRNSSPRNKLSSRFSLSPRIGSKKSKPIDYDAFLDEYESSNDYRESGGEESFDLMSYKSKSYSDFEASEGESESDRDGVQGDNDETEDGESYDSSDEEEEDDDQEEDIASPLYGEPKTELEVL